MNKASLLLLVTLVQSQSDGILLPNPNSPTEVFDDNLEDFQIQDWDNSEFPFSADQTKLYDQINHSYGKRSGGDVLTRRSALDKNFMRFGRDLGKNDVQKFHRPRLLGSSNSKSSFFRFGRGFKDNFIRFGRGAQENFIRFGRGGKEGFIRFGRIPQDDFLRSGKSIREDFIRFGKLDKNFMRFGRDKIDNDSQQTNEVVEYLPYLEETKGRYVEETPESFARLGKSPKGPDNFIRFGKNGKEGRNGTNFLRFGKKDPVDEAGNQQDADDDEEDRNQDSFSLAPNMRIKRETMETVTEGTDREKDSKNYQKTTNNSKSRTEVNPETPKLEKRSTGYFEEPGESFPRRFPQIFPGNYLPSLENLRNSRLATPYFPIPPELPKSVANPYWVRSGFDIKRNHGSGSNFIRFG